MNEIPATIFAQASKLAGLAFMLDLPKITVDLGVVRSRARRIEDGFG